MIKEGETIVGTFLLAIQLIKDNASGKTRLDIQTKMQGFNHDQVIRELDKLSDYLKKKVQFKYEKGMTEFEDHAE